MNKRGLMEWGTLIEVLMHGGYIRVDGLRVSPVGAADDRIIELSPGETIRWERNNGVCVVALPDGTVWARENDEDANDAHRIVVTAAKKERVEVEEGHFVPLSNGENVSYRDLMRRVANPYWVPSYHFTEKAIAAGFGPQ